MIELCWLRNRPLRFFLPHPTHWSNPHITSGNLECVGSPDDQNLKIHDLRRWRGGCDNARGKLSALFDCVVGVRHLFALAALSAHFTIIRTVRCFKNLDYYPFSLFSRQSTPFVTTLHGRLDLPEHQAVFATFPSIPVISGGQSSSAYGTWAAARS
jgi:hypothetical protein